MRVERPATKTLKKPRTPDFAAVWNRIESHSGQEFRTVRGLPFSYTVVHGAVYPSRTKRKIPRSDFEKALVCVPLKNAAVIQDLRGPSFIYAILMDARIRAAEW
jgi:hypothetical protein